MSVTPPGRTLRLGTRGSLLATTQSRWVAARLSELGVRAELTVIRTTGDRLQHQPLPEIGGKGLFTKELDSALLDGEVDLAVHSLKDLPTQVEEGIEVSAVPVREDPRDVLIGERSSSVTLESLPEGARVGTSSLRRQALALAFRSDLEVAPIRGNLDTRIRKVDEGEYEAIVVAGAGVRRLDFADRISQWLERTAWLPAPGQGALAVVTRSDDPEIRDVVAAVDHPETRAAVDAERTLLAELEGGCRLPVAALAMPYSGGLRLWGLVASPDGRHLVRADRTGRADRPRELGREVAELLLRQGAGEVLGRVRNHHFPVAAPLDRGDDSLDP